MRSFALRAWNKVLDYFIAGLAAIAGAAVYTAAHVGDGLRSFAYKLDITRRAWRATHAASQY